MINVVNIYIPLAVNCLGLKDAEVKLKFGIFQVSILTLLSLEHLRYSLIDASAQANFLPRGVLR